LEKGPQPTVAFVPWGDVFEDFFGTIGVSLDDYCNEFTGSWHIGLINALKSQDVETVVYYTSTLVRRTHRRIHRPTGAKVVIVPAPRVYRAIYNRMIHPHHSFAYWSGVDALFGPSAGLRRRWLSTLRIVAPYLATPIQGLAREIRRDRCGSILCQDYENAGFDRAILLGSLLRRPVFAIFQGGAAEWNAIGRYVRPRTMKRCSGFIVAPRDEAKRIGESYAVEPERIHQIFNALDESIWAPADRTAARESLGMRPGAQIVVWHGRTDIYIKGLDLLLDAWEGILRERPGRNLQLALLGAGQDSQALRQRIAKLPDGSVLWIDRFVSDRQFVRSFLAAGDVYAFPSRIEGQPSAPVEALASGLPVVAADASGIRDIFEHGEASGGIVVPSGDLPAFAAALGRLLDDENLRRALAAMGRQRAKAFASRDVGAQLRAVLFPELQRVATASPLESAPRTGDEISGSLQT
jgi:glycosyltransferase involved in cell wall biosynthesis